MWTPTQNTINARAIPDNLFAFFAANQADAFTWAGDGSLKPVKKFSDSVANRSAPVFPAMAFSDDADAVDYTGDVLDGAYQLTLEFMITNSDPDEAVRQSRIYAKAFVSMLVNCPDATLIANTGANTTVIEDVTVGFDPIRSDEEQIDFMQLFQIRATIRLNAGYHA